MIIKKNDLMNSETFLKGISPATNFYHFWDRNFKEIPPQFQQDLAT